MKRFSLVVLCLSCFAASGGDFPRVWMSAVLSPDMEETIRMCAEQGVDCVEVPTWGAEVCGKSLAALRKHGMRGFTSCGPEISMDTRGAVKGEPCERAVCTGGAYCGLSIDRNVFEFSAGPHEIVVEPPVYSAGQPYARTSKDADGVERTVRSGHYFGSLRPTGKAEVIVPERPFDGAPHVRVIPCEVLPARADDVPENDSAAGLYGPEIEDRRLVRIRFDLTDCADCLLDKVGIAVYWESDPDGATWRNGVGQLSVFSELTRDAVRRSGEWRANQWAIANGGTFPSNEIVAIRFGDECFNITGWADGPACSFPLWGFSESGRAAFDSAAPGLVQPRTWGFPEIYGAEACGTALYEFHRACANLVKAFREGVRKVTPGLLVFRNTTRGGVWSECNDHDGSGQELLARELDFLHLDPYPVGREYAAERIPCDMGYISGLARRYGKPLVPWMQAHAYAPNGLGHVTPGEIRRMWAQHEQFAPAGIMWLGFGIDNNPQSFSKMTFPNGSPESWALAKELHVELHKAPGWPRSVAAADAEAARTEPVSPNVAPLAVVRPYATRAARCWLSGGRFRNPADCHLEAFALAWGVDCGLPFDVFETPPSPTPAERDALARELSRYGLVVSTEPIPGVPGARILGAGTEGTILDTAVLAAIRRAFAEEIQKVADGAPIE